ncbi:MAG: SDR family oxidoreductase [Candidatus Auribacter fodinae]|jgi:dTDP-4-dehydrorhamnose reductase|uniref:SDR family oxidoreductase n=1 Tax=Candidatus Auribacter fodinae TaxID=2093366 RepID=A0A3A4QV03_9BACT|nr:MAG: SDR family oxidoreductase [Candidatus Auribacter fodinae]
MTRSDQNPVSMLITGASGFLGSNAARYFADKADVAAHGYKTAPAVANTRTAMFNLESEQEIRDAIRIARPDIVIHFAALKSPDDCKQYPQYARRINIDGTRHIINYANDIGVPVIFISTDLVFDGRKGSYTESDTPNPVNYYGETKLIAEDITLSALNKNRVCRITLAYGKRFSSAPGGYLDSFLQSYNSNKTQNLFTDQWRTPLFSGDLCSVLDALCFNLLEGKLDDCSRLYHIGGAEKMSRYELGKAICSVFQLNEELINPVTMDQSPLAAERGKDCSMDITTARTELSYAPAPVLESLTFDKTIRQKERNHGSISSN